MEKNLAIAEPSLINSLNVGMSNVDAAIAEVASAIPTFKAPVMERIDLIKKIEISKESIGSVKDSCKDIKKICDGIDGFRKRSKNEILSHYQPIEDACHNLKNEINDAIAPVKDNIVEYEEELKHEKEILINSWIVETVESMQLDAEYVELVYIEKRWYNASRKAVIRGIEAQLNALLSEEKVEQMQENSYQEILAVENSKMIHDMTIDEFETEGKSQKRIIAEINERAALYRQVEKDAIATVSSENPKEQVNHGFLIRVFADESRLDEVIKLLEINNIYARAE